MFHSSVSENVRDSDSPVAGQFIQRWEFSTISV